MWHVIKSEIKSAQAVTINWKPLKRRGKEKEAQCAKKDVFYIITDLVTFLFAVRI